MLIAPEPHPADGPTQKPVRACAAGSGPTVSTPTSKACRALALATAALVSLVAGCATSSADIEPRPGDPAAYAGWDCERIFDASDVVRRRAIDVAYEVDSRVGSNLVALGLGVTMFWPALLAMRPDGPEAVELADLKGRDAALRTAAALRNCGPLPSAMAASRLAALPIALGDRLVFDERSGDGGPARTLAMTVTALRRDQIDFKVQINGRDQSALWRQDLAGNPLLDVPVPLIGWRRLLKQDLVLGQVLAGDLVAASGLQPNARVRGQVVAIGPQTVAGRAFDVAVIELFGEAPSTGNGPGQGTSGSARLDGVMAVDRHSGILLRLELRCANADFAIRRRLLRVEAPAR
jgi:hypothetical protein